MDNLSVNFLGSKLMEVIGAPLSTYQKALLSLREALPAINTTGFQDSTMRWYLSNQSEADGNTSLQAAIDARNDYATMQYYELFYDGKSIYTKRKQSAANETDPNLDPGTTKIM